MYYTHLVIRKLLARPSFFIPDPLTQEQDRHPSLLVKNDQSRIIFRLIYNMAHFGKVDF